MNTPPKVGELLAYGSVAGFSAMVNYAVFAGLVVAGVGPIAALALATAATMTINFLGFKKLVFRRS
jgi:putative flippase GtrA